MSISSTVNGNTINIKISGRFDFSNHKEFREAYRNTPEGSTNEFVIDMSETEYVDSSALGMMLLLREHAGSEQSNVSIKDCRSEVKDILMVSNFDKLFKIS
ncbi:MAG: STAS domain-containing protein [gamma proteobacterium symbiont of Bathyaustriella thionipta]|nr:STAS domain-containing protein [gamma proteobacterium symbiont of Bathyaustriella thionipta]MCU7951264.1 STAS domain-containing protein [gamma proteobacterium symbiont of Bathyaustriella thionipta]MCU7951899.1 STAS domain-containing protein [gamma proteobacterium symbiont of Bathyaustriella thionipta]MCU7957823.1 STAS domain-containing protein [gamma proteobacterium symbiont of Bathyaustriella thionipta]MCU7967715.1 STAS domain-containing protein [gamma proteobacterium symbiont of Bathyaustr